MTIALSVGAGRSRRSERSPEELRRSCSCRAVVRRATDTSLRRDASVVHREKPDPAAHLLAAVVATQRLSVAYRRAATGSGPDAVDDPTHRSRKQGRVVRG
jgi:hypothetical protein